MPTIADPNTVVQLVRAFRSRCPNFSVKKFDKDAKIALNRVLTARAILRNERRKIYYGEVKRALLNGACLQLVLWSGIGT